ncbi:MAG: hypothetical protein QXT63_05480 [Thermoplasmata archaeon]
MVDEADVRIIEKLIDDPRESIRTLAKMCRLGRQKLYSRQKKLEDTATIWGYTTVINPLKFGGRLYIVLGKLKELTKETAKKLEYLHKRMNWKELGIRIIGVYYLMGEYDWMLVYEANNLESAKKSHDFIKQNYEGIFSEEIKMLEVILPLVHQGKINPKDGELEKLAAPAIEQRSSLLEEKKLVAKFPFGKR